MKRGEKDPLLRRIVSGVLVAVIPAMLAYVVSFVDGRRREELTYVNSQIAKLYGPLYALTHANDVAWEQFVSADWPVGKGRYFFDPMRPPTIEQVDKWRLWMTTVFQPLNVEMETRIINNSQLILGRHESHISPRFSPARFPSDEVIGPPRSWARPGPAIRECPPRRGIESISVVAAP